MAAKKTALAGLCVVVMLGLCVLAGAAKGETDSKNVAADAYKLRMQGKVDDARALLEQAIQENPHNASAHYELARTKFYMALHPDPQSREDRIGEAQKSIEKAIENDPNNVIYPFFEGHIALLQAYPSWMQDQPDTKEKMGRVCEAFESALKLKPDYRQAMLYLVEIYGTLSEDKGGDKSKAEQYAKKLEGMDEVFGAKARWILMPKDPNRVEYWQKVMKNHESNTDVLEEMGKAYLSADNVNDAVLCFEKAIKIDPAKSYLFLDLSIYHTWAAMAARDNAELRQKAITAGEAAVTRYLDSNPVLPMRAYALGVQYKYKSHSEHKEGADDILKKARELDPYFSMMTGAPNPDLFIAVDEISHNHRYLFRPVQ
ncbi:MAG: tetratricopeptide repeat protein [Sedimentisphaerales bacterium]|jgi:tetratricopeptide (TPR) repeat protein